ncbi:MAG: hypothetical protein UMV23_07305 [Halanaerobium sp.]|nr:hypothetical protein [Halanaerobium sp.]
MRGRKHYFLVLMTFILVFVVPVIPASGAEIVLGEIIRLSEKQLTLLPRGAEMTRELDLAEDVALLQNGVPKSAAALNPVFPGVYQDGLVCLEGNKVVRVEAYYQALPARVLEIDQYCCLFEVFPDDRLSSRPSGNLQLLPAVKWVRFFPGGELMRWEELPVVEGGLYLVITGVDGRIVALAQN